MTSLSIGNNLIDNLEGLAKNILYLSAGSNKFSTLKGLQTALGLRVLILNNSLVKDLSSLRFLMTLLYLDLSASNLTENVVEEIQSPLLLYLNACNNLFRSVPDIPSLALYELRLSGNMITQIPRMNWLYNLRVLDLSNNQLSDIVPLGNCPFLREIYISNNEIKEFSNVYALSVCRQVTVLDMSGNPINGNSNIFKTVGTLFPKLQVIVVLKRNSIHTK